MKFRKKPVVIEAFQMRKLLRWDSNQWPKWLDKAWNMESHEPGAFYCKNASDEVYIRTLEGELLVTWDDWIIKGVQGELYPCKPDIFKATYEEVK